MKHLSIYTLLIMCFFFMFTSCTTIQKEYAIQTSIIAVESTALKDQYTKVESLMRSIQKQKQIFTVDEWKLLLLTDETIDLLISKYIKFHELNTVQIPLIDVTYMYSLAKQSYTEGKSVVYAHWDDFQLNTKIILESFDKQAIQTSIRIEKLLADPTTKNVNEALRLIPCVVNILLKMLTTSILQ